LFHRWFVQYNPLYFFSALCVLAGVLLISRSLPEVGLDRGRLFLAGVVQLYELLLIGAAALLFRAAGQRRPAVMLAIVAIPFLFDWTFQTETLSVVGEAGIIAAAVWAALVPIKMLLLAWTFRLRGPAILLLILAVASAVVAGMPQVMNRTAIDAGLLHLGSLWLFAALVAAVLRLWPKVRSSEKLEPWGHTVLLRTLRAAGVMWAGLYLMHAGTWMIQFNVDPHPLQAVPFVLLLPFLIRHESLAWLSAAGAVAISTLYPTTVAPTAAFVGLLFVIHAYGLRQKRAYVGALLSFHIGLWTTGWQGGPFPPSDLLLSLITAAALLGVAWKSRLPTAVVAAVLVLLLVPRSILEWGITVLAIGFIALLAGVMINWHNRLPMPGAGPRRIAGVGPERS
jgi:hypothetical protein